jgi:uncharacterized membrane protein YfcA
MSSLYLEAPFATLLVTSVVTTGGVGGAFILVPVLSWLGLPIYEAETLGLLMALFSSGSASIGYHHGGHIRFRMAAALIAGMLVASPAGSYVSAVVGQDLIFTLFCLLLVVGGSMMFFYSPRSKPDSPGARLSRADYAFGVVAGVVVGFFSGLLGIGGGILLGPFLLWRGLHARDLSGTSSIFVAFSALTGFLGHLDFMRYAHAHVDYLLFGSVVVAALGGGAVGSYLARFRLSAVQIRRVIGALEYLMAIKMLWGLAFGQP